MVDWQGRYGILGFGLWIVGCRLGEWFWESFQRNADFYGCCSPILPLSCQSVRMGFLAVSPGVHLIDTLTLMDVETSTIIDMS